MGWLVCSSGLRSSSKFLIFVVSLALLTDMVVYDVIVPIIPELLSRANVNDRFVGLLYSVYSVGYLSCSPIVGIISDKYKSRTTPMIVSQLGLALATLMFVKSRSIYTILLARLIQGIHKLNVVILILSRNSRSYNLDSEYDSGGGYDAT